MSSLPDQSIMKQRFIKISSEYLQDTVEPDTEIIPDSMAVLTCKALEDYMKNLLENLATLKYGHQPLLRPPISYIFPNVQDTNDIVGVNSVDYFGRVTERDLKLLFQMKPWLLADMELDLLDWEERELT